MWLFCILIAILANVLAFSYADAPDFWIPHIGVETPRSSQTEITIEHLDQLDAVPYQSRVHHVLPKYEPFRIKLSIRPLLIACDKNRTFRNLNWEKACFAPDPRPGCHDGNIIGLFICWDSLYENYNYPNYMKNLDPTKNNVTKACTSGKGTGDKIQHGIGIAICAQRNGTHHILMGQVHMSYSDKIYHLSKIERPQKKVENKYGVEFPVQLATILIGFIDTILLDYDGRIVNNDEPMTPIFGMSFGTNDQAANKYLPLKASFSDIIPIKQTNGSVFRKLRFVYSDKSHYCHAFEPSEMNGKKIAFSGCKVIHKIPKTGAEIFGSEKKFGETKNLKEKICELMWTCMNGPDAFPPDIPPKYFDVPSYIGSMQSPDKNSKNPMEAFFELYGCNDDQRLDLGGDMPWEDVSEEALEQWQECVNKSKAEEPKIQRKKRNIPTRANFKWELPIKYMVDESADYDIGIIHRAIQNIEDQTCITFIEDDKVSENEPHLYFTREPFCGASCVSEGIGRNYDDVRYANLCGKQKARHGIHFDTEHFGVIVHQIGHALGLYHEEDRPDSDQYIWTRYGVYYNMVSRHHIYQESIGMDVMLGLSFKDAKVLNFAYCDAIQGCGKLKENSLGCENSGYPDPKKECQKCRCQDGIAGAKCEKLAESDRNKCWTNNKKFDLGPTKAKNYKLEGKITGKGSCYWRIAPKDTKTREHFIQKIEITKINGLNCPNTMRTCGQHGWIRPCVNYLRIHFQDEKAEGGARLCCQPKLPFVLPAETLSHLSKKVLLALKVEEETKEEVRFEMEIKIGAIDKPTTTTSTTTTTTTTPPIFEFAKKCPDFRKRWLSEPLRKLKIEPIIWSLGNVTDTVYYNCHCVGGSTLTINGHIPFDHDHSECPQGGCVHCQEATSLCGAQCNTEADKKPMFYAQCYKNTEDGKKGWYWKDGNGKFIRVDGVQCLLKP